MTREVAPPPASTAPGLLLRHGEQVSRHGNLRLGGEVDAYGVAHDEDALLEALARSRGGEGPLRLLYGWDEIQAHEEGLNGLLLRLGVEFAAVALTEEGLRVGAACPLARVGVLAASRLELSSIARLREMPGTLGGWIEALGLERLAPALLSVRVAHGHTVRELSPERAASLKGSRIWIAATLARDIQASIPGPPPPGAVASLDGELALRMRQSGLAGLRLRGIRLASEQVGLVTNLGQGSPRDLAVLLRTLRDRLSRDHGIDFQARLVLGTRPAPRRARRLDPESQMLEEEP